MMIASIIIGVVSISHWNRKDGGQYDGYDKYENDKYKKYYYEHYGKSERPYGVSIHIQLVILMNLM